MDAAYKIGACVTRQQQRNRPMIGLAPTSVRTLFYSASVFVNKCCQLANYFDSLQYSTRLRVYNK